MIRLYYINVALYSKVHGCVHLYDATNISIMKEFQPTKYRLFKFDKINYTKINKIPKATHWFQSNGLLTYL